jgi:hypothetical protein
MARRILNRWMSGIAASTALLIHAAAPAFADPPTAEQATEGRLPEVLRPRVDHLDRDGRWFRSDFHIQKKSGFAYTHRFATSDRPLVFRIQGPVMRKQKAVGLTFKFCF